MSRRRPDQFLDAIQACFREFDARGTVLDRIAPLAPADDFHRRDWLESHARRYVIDHLLRSLGWDIAAAAMLSDHIENMQLEMGVLSVGTGNRRFMDYLGCERELSVPLLLVEAKRPELQLTVTSANPSPDAHPFADEVYRHLSADGTARRGRRRGAAGLSSEWCKYIDALNSTFAGFSTASMS